MRNVLLTGLLLGATSLEACAAGVNLTWGTGCWADNPQVVMNFACDTNAGSAFMVGSFALSADMPAFVGIEAVLDGKSDGTLPDWWELYNPGACRQTGLSVSSDFIDAPGGCVDPWNGLAMGGIGAYQTWLFPPPPPLNVPAPDRARLKLAYVLTDPNPLQAGVEYYGFRVRVNYAKTVDPGACAGCASGMKFVLQQIKAAPLPGTPEWVTNELDNRCLLWNDPSWPCTCTPAITRTWGQVKGLYR